MSVSFYNANGVMAGLDWHDFFTGEPPAPPVEIPVPHLVGATFGDSCEEEKARIKNVTADRKPMIQKEFKLTLILPHVPISPLPPYVGVQALNYAIIFALSGSTAFLGVASVTGGGASLATCVHSCLGCNLNCGDPIDQPINIVVNPNSVLTQPTDADYADALFTFLINAIIGKLVGLGFNKLLGDTWKDFVKKELKDRLVIPIRKRFEDEVKSWLNDKAKPLNDMARSRDKAKAALSSLGVTHV